MLSRGPSHAHRGPLRAVHPGCFVDVHTFSSILDGLKTVSRFRDETRSRNSPNKLATPKGNGQLGPDCLHTKPPENSCSRGDQVTPVAGHYVPYTQVHILLLDVGAIMTLGPFFADDPSLTSSFLLLSSLEMSDTKV